MVPVDNPHGLHLVLLAASSLGSKPHLLVNLSDRERETDDPVVDQQLHPIVIFQESHQLTVSADLVLHISHQRTHTHLRTAVRVALQRTKQIQQKYIVCKHNVTAPSKIYIFQKKMKRSHNSNRSILTLQARLAQSVEHGTLNPRVVGSSPTLGAIF